MDLEIFEGASRSLRQGGLGAQSPRSYRVFYVVKFRMLPNGYIHVVHLEYPVAINFINRAD